MWKIHKRTLIVCQQEIQLQLSCTIMHTNRIGVSTKYALLLVTSWTDERLHIVATCWCVPAWNHILPSEMDKWITDWLADERAARTDGRTAWATGLSTIDIPSYPWDSHQCWFMEIAHNSVRSPYEKSCVSTYSLVLHTLWIIYDHLLYKLVSSHDGVRKGGQINQQTDK